MMDNKVPTVLIIDDDKAICDFVDEALVEGGYTCDFALSANDAIIKLRNQCFDVTLLDIKLPDKSGLALLETMQSLFQTTTVIVMTAVKDLDTAVHAMQLGALDYIVKPFTIDKLTSSITTVLKNRKGYHLVSKNATKMGNNNNSRNAACQSLRTMNAIALGIDIQLDYFDFHSKTVAEKTVNLARQLGLPTKEIEQWVIVRNEIYSEKMRYINSMLSKLWRNPLAQMMLGLTRLKKEFPETGGEQN